MQSAVVTYMTDDDLVVDRVFLAIDEAAAYKKAREYVADRETRYTKRERQYEIHLGADVVSV